MSAPQFDAVLDALVAQLRAASGFADPESGLTGVPVYDGPVPTGAKVNLFVAIGWDGIDGGDSEAASWESEPGSLGPASDRRETGYVTGVCIAQDGSDKFGPLRSTVASTIGLIDASIRSTPALGLAPVVLWGELNRGSVAQGVGRRGAYVKADFTVTYYART